MKKILAVFAIILMALTTSCGNKTKNDTIFEKIEEEGYYTTYAFVDNIIRLPKFVKDMAIQYQMAKKYYVFDYEELKEIFEYSTGEKASKYFKKKDLKKYNVEIVIYFIYLFHDDIFLMKDFLYDENNKLNYNVKQYLLTDERIKKEVHHGFTTTYTFIPKELFKGNENPNLHLDDWM